MREYLFRGKRVDNGEWVYGYYVKGATRHCVLKSLAQSHIYDVIPESVGQYIGFKDKNGNKIFEGDVVEFLDIDKFKWKGVVVYQKECSLYIVKANSGWEFAFYDIFEERVEVIGNIIDNKELLGE